MAERTVVYAGTFDPITDGHTDLVKRALRVFDSVIVAVARNPEKEPLFSLEERVQLARQSLKGVRNVKVEPFSGLLVDYLKEKGRFVILRGLRELSDFELEFQQALMNRRLYPECDTVFVMTDAKYFYVNSSVVKEIASLGGNINGFVPKPVEAALRKKFHKRG